MPLASISALDQFELACSVRGAFSTSSASRVFLRDFLEIPCLIMVLLVLTEIHGFLSVTHAARQVVF